MLRLMATGATALALFAVPASAQDTGSNAASGSGGAQADVRETAMRSAEGAGMQEVQNMEGAFVLQGIAQSGMPVLMVVGPAGELIALATPIMPQGGSGTGAEGGTGTDAQVAPGAAGGGSGTGVETGGEQAAEPGPGEPAQGGFMATQTDPATPGMWDPAMVEGAMQSLELGQRGAAGQVTEPEVQQQ